MSSSTLDHPPLKTPLPPNKCIQKRPLLHPPIHAPLHTSQDRIVYISASTPFISAVKRVEGFLSSKIGTGERNEVILKATGRAIDRALQVGCYFMERESEKVVVRTGTVEVIDDVVEKMDYGQLVEGEKTKDKKDGPKKRKKGKGGSEVVEEKSGIEEDNELGDVEMGDGKEDEATKVEEEEIFMKSRKTSMVEIVISSTEGG